MLLWCFYDDFMTIDDDFIMILWWFYDDFMMSLWWFYNDFMMMQMRIVMREQFWYFPAFLSQSNNGNIYGRSRWIFGWIWYNHWPHPPRISWSWTWYNNWPHPPWLRCIKVPKEECVQGVGPTQPVCTQRPVTRFVSKKHKKICSNQQQNTRTRIINRK